MLIPLLAAISVEEVVVLRLVGRIQGPRALGWWSLLVLGVNLATIPGMNAVLAVQSPPPASLRSVVAQTGRVAETFASSYDPLLVLALEAAVVVVEAAAYAVGGRLRVRTALIVALAANAASFVVQVLAEMV